MFSCNRCTYIQYFFTCFMGKDSPSKTDNIPPSPRKIHEVTSLGNTMPIIQKFESWKTSTKELRGLNLNLLNSLTRFLLQIDDKGTLCKLLFFDIF